VTVFRTWEDATSENIAAWVAAQPAGLATYAGNGMPYYETIGQSAMRASAWDGSVVARCSGHDWMQMVSNEWRCPHRHGVDGDRRFVDYSDMVPASARTLRVFADYRIPPGHGLVETPDGRALCRVTF
jgi:hypothetical protein